jgi:hypothetical protein
MEMGMPVRWCVSLLLAGYACLGPALVYGQSSDKGGTVTYRWVDEKGVVHYGDRIPAQDSQKESAILNRQGVELNRHDAQRSPAEQAEQLKRDEEQAKIEQHDAFLLTTYTSPKDIEDLRDTRLAELNGQHAAEEQYIATLNSRLASYQSQAMNFKPYSDDPKARKMPDDLAENLVHTLSELRTQRSAIAAKDQEALAVRTEFDSDIQRYKKLRATRLDSR